MIIYIGWVALIASWIVPQFIKEKQKAAFIGGALAAFATGLFVGALITKLYI
jgi:hypothetical protein